MLKTLGTLLVATRPWSFGASVSCCLLYAGVALSGVEVGALPQALQRVLVAVVGVLCLQGGANVLNSYVDFRSGVDSKEHADDRTLVDGHLTGGSALGLSGALFAGGVWLTWLEVQWQGPLLLPLGAAGLMVGVLYSARPFSLKYWGLGDVAVFLAFGPLLMYGVALVALGKEGVGQACSQAVSQARLPALDRVGALGYLQGVARVAFDPASLWGGMACVHREFPSLLAFSAALGLLVVQILHANNVRDMGVDRAGGVLTVARALGVQGSTLYFGALFAAAFAAAALGVLQHTGSTHLGTTAILDMYTALVEDHAQSQSLLAIPRSVLFRGGVMGSVLLLNLAPVASELVRRMGARELRTLPQACAQFATVFAIVTLVAGDFVPHPWACMALRMALSVFCLLVYQPAMVMEGNKAFHAAEFVGGGEGKGKRLAATHHRASPEVGRGDAEGDLHPPKTIKSVQRGRSRTPRNRSQ
jgi:1,4-dihydroxy-2-naphthoate octaprenyltransferase